MNAHFENSEVLEESSCDHIYVDDVDAFMKMIMILSF